MKILPARPLLRPRILPSTCVHHPKCIVIPQARSAKSSPRRYQGTAIDASKWTKHTLSTSKIPPNGASVLQKAAKKQHVAYIAFGSNLGDRIGWIERACNEMSEKGITILRTSSLWETDPMYVLDQDKFVNGVCEVSTELEPIELLDTLQGIERSLGREKLIEKGPRNIDLDVLLYDQEVINHERLIVPHPLMYEREFVLRPLAQIAPALGLNPGKPWITTTDYLNNLPPSPSPISTLTPLNHSSPPLRALDPHRRTLLMSILNFTPDSFSNDIPSTPNPDLALSQLPSLVKSHLSAGVSILDIGGQSSAPNAPSISASEEIARTIPAITALRKHFPGPISIDTYRAAVASAAVAAGADIINDVSAGTLDPDMLSLMASTGKTVCLMHMRGTPATMQSQENTDYSTTGGLIPGIATELLSRVEAAMAAGVRRWRIILDPGMGFSKTTQQNLEIVRRLDELREWPGLEGLPWLVGASRKRFIGEITGVDVPRERVEGTGVVVSAAVRGGADAVRVHDVVEMGRVVRMSDAIWRGYNGVK